MKRVWMAILMGGLVFGPAIAAIADPTPPLEAFPVTPGPTVGASEVTTESEIEHFIDDLDLNTVKDITTDQAAQSIVFDCPLGTTCPGGIIIEQAGAAPVNIMGIYDLSDPGSSLATIDEVAIFVGADNDGIDGVNDSTAKTFFFDPVDSSVVVDANNNNTIDGGEDTGIVFGSGTTFGLFINNGGDVFFSEDARNPGLRRHVLIFHSETGGTGTLSGTQVPAHSFMFAFEDLREGLPNTDFDYQDFLYHFQLSAIPDEGIIPEPGSMLLFGLGGLGAVGLGRGRRRNRKSS